MSTFPTITRVAKYVPSNEVTNDMLSQILDTSHHWIKSRTGISERRIVTTETTSDLATQVAKQLLKGRDPDSLDFIIVATMTSDYATPSTSCLVQKNIHATRAFAFDVNAACSGFIYALSTAEALISSGKYQTGMVIGAETMSSLLDWQDRSTSVLFGDGAAGVLLEKTSPYPSFVDELIESDGSRAMSLYAQKRLNLNPYFEVKDMSEGLKMTGKDIFDFALRDVSQHMLALLSENSEFSEKIDYVLAHQANYRILEALSKKTHIPFEKFLSNVHHYGNTSAASVPLLFAENIENETLKLGSGQRLLLTGYGAGLTWGSMLLTL